MGGGRVSLSLVLKDSTLMQPFSFRSNCGWSSHKSVDQPRDLTDRSESPFVFGASFRD